MKPISTLICIIPLLTLPVAGISAAPDSADAFLAEIRSAIKEKNTVRIVELTYLEDPSDEDRAQAQMAAEFLIGEGNIVDIRLGPLEDDQPNFFVMQGSKIEPTHPPVGTIEVDFENPAGSASAAYTIVEGRYHLVGTKTTDLGWDGPPDKNIGFMITGRGQDALEIKGKWNASGVEIESGFSHPSATFWGQFIEELAITSDSEETDVELVITEEGKPVVEGKRLQGVGTLEYRRRD